MKKISVLAMIGVMVFGLTACGSPSAGTQSAESTGTTQGSDELGTNISSSHLLAEGFEILDGVALPVGLTMRLWG